MTDSAPPAAEESVLVIGEALVDLIRRADGDDVPLVGGSPLNVAIGLSRLGAPTALWTTFGRDDHGALIAQHLAVNDVAVVDGSVSARPTSVAVAEIQRDGSAHYTFDLAWAPQPFVGAEPVHVHTGSIAAFLEPGAALVRSSIARFRATATVSFDPNVRPQLVGQRGEAVRRVEAFVALSDVVKASDEDLVWLYPDEDVLDVAERWCRSGPALVVVTRGAEGALAVTRGGVIDVPAPVVEVVDTIGAGDSFMAALLAALSDQGLLGRRNEDRLRSIGAEAVRAALAFAIDCAAVTVGRPGADPPRRGPAALARDS